MSGYRVSVDLPGATAEEAEAFGLWLDMTLREAWERGELGSETRKITVSLTGPGRAAVADWMRKQAMRNSDRGGDAGVSGRVAPA